MKIIIIGAGDVGLQIARQLISEKKDVVLIDQDPARTKYASSTLDCQILTESGNNPQVLKKAGIEKTDFFISVTDSDELNMISCGLIANEYPHVKKIARVRNIDYFTGSLLEKTFLGIDYIVNSDIEASQRIIRTIDHGVTSDIIFFEQSDLQMQNIIVTEDSFFRNRRVSEIRKEMGLEFLIAGIMRNTEFLIPKGDMDILEDDTIYLLANLPVMEKIFKQIGQPATNIKKILIVGGGRIGRYLSSYFLGKPSSSVPGIFQKVFHFLFQRDKKVIKIIDKDYDKCRRIAREIPEARVVHADISDETVFQEERLSEYDLIVSTTTNQELNVLSAVYAKKMGIRKAISLVGNVNYINIATRLGIDVIISPKNSIVNPILKFIRQGNIKTLHTLPDSQVDILELSIDLSSPLHDKLIKNIRFPAQSLVMSVSRGGRHVIPDGDFRILEGDHIIIMAHQDGLQKIEKMVTEK